MAHHHGIIVANIGKRVITGNIMRNAGDTESGGNRDGWHHILLFVSRREQLARKSKTPAA
jgi:hypothetical protein